MWIIKFLVWINVSGVWKQLVHVQHKTHFQRTWHSMHKCRLQILMLLFIHCTHISMNEGPFFPHMFKALSPTAKKKSYFLWFVPFKSISNYWEHERKVYVKSFLHIFAGLLFSLSTAGALLTSLLYRPLLRAEKCFHQKYLLCSRGSPLVLKKSVLYGKSIFH